ncbi:MAG: penicillin acylase family protein [Ignavibacteria bacterium]|nr:penicillin acylase family protein [Ignavibacteria bacterium]
MTRFQIHRSVLLKSGIFICITVVFLIIVGWVVRRTLLHTLPDYDGKLSASEISAPIDIYRDEWAIPTILAANESDGAFALGYVHAQERFFQMDLMRRAAEGRLSEIFGSKVLAFDRMFLTIGIDRTAQAIWAAARPETKHILTAYAAGVNEYLHTHKNTLSIEFDVAEYQPADWQPVNSIEIIRLMAWELNIAWWEDMIFTNIANKVGREKAEKIFPFYDENGSTREIPKDIPQVNPKDLSFYKTDRDFRQFAGMSGTHIGSNNWVLSGKKTYSGKVIMANDPHLAHQAPAKWYIANIHAGNYDACGVTLPGIPCVVIGHNRNITWSLTNVMADDADFYVEKISQDKTQYMLDNEWKPLKKLVYNRKVKDSSDVKIEVFLNHRGPIISDIHPANLLYPQQKSVQTAVSMRWTGNDISDEFFGFYSINMANNWDDFRRAVSHFAVPGQNFLYGDKQGNIGYICGAKLPIRNGGNAGFALDGTTSAHDWKGYLPYDQMPTIYNPEQGYIATANNKVVKSFSTYISNLWEPSSRITRINQLIQSKEKLTVQDVKNMQMDVNSPYAYNLTQYILDAFKNVKITDAQLQEAVTVLSTWDGEFDGTSQAPAIYAMWFKYMLRNTLMDDLGKDLFNEFCFVANVPYRVMERLLKENPVDIFDNISTPQVETRNDIIRKSLSNAVSELESTMGKDLKTWQWNRLHTVTFRHTFHGTSRFIDKIVDIGPFPIGGDGTTIFNTEYPFYEYHGEMSQFITKPFDNVLGPSIRFIYDYDKPEEVSLILPTGQSGHFFSAHYSDMTKNWLYGGYCSLITNGDPEKYQKYHIKFIRR